MFHQLLSQLINLIRLHEIFSTAGDVKMVKFPLISLRFIAAAFFMALLLCKQNFVVGKSEECDNPDAVLAEDPSCPSRPHIVRCAGEYLDKNKNKMLERSELEDAIDSLPWYSKGTLL